MPQVPSSRKNGPQQVYRHAQEGHGYRDGVRTFLRRHEEGGQADEQTKDGPKETDKTNGYDSVRCMHGRYWYGGWNERLDTVIACRAHLRIMAKKLPSHALWNGSSISCGSLCSRRFIASAISAVVL